MAMQCALSLLTVLWVVSSGFRVSPSPHTPPNSTTALKAHLQMARSKAQGPACQCQPHDLSWKQPAPRAPTCLFFDLGANDGETFRVFNGQSEKWTFNYETPGFMHSQCYSYLIEANPRFQWQLEQLRSPKVYPMAQVAAYMCDKPSETFHIDVGDENGWGSSLNGTHDAVANVSAPVEVRLENLMRLLIENALPDDQVVVKMDIEGAEWDILPCLARSPAVHLIDTLYLENHCEGSRWCPSTGQAGTTWGEWNASLAAIRHAGVKIPEGYWSPML